MNGSYYLLNASKTCCDNSKTSFAVPPSVCGCLLRPSDSPPKHPTGSSGGQTPFEVLVQVSQAARQQQILLRICHIAHFQNRNRYLRPVDPLHGIRFPYVFFLVPTALAAALANCSRSILYRSIGRQRQIASHRSPSFRRTFYISKQA